MANIGTIISRPRSRGICAGLVALSLFSSFPALSMSAGEYPSHKHLPANRAAGDKGLLEDARDIVEIAREVRGLLKSLNASGGANANKGQVDKELPFSVGDAHELIGLIRDVRDLVKSEPKANKTVFVPDLHDLIRQTAPLYEALKSQPEFREEKFGIAEVAAAVAIAREVRELTKSNKASVDKIGIAEVAAAVAIAREVHALLKAVPIDETKGITVGVSVGIKAGDKGEIVSRKAGVPDVDSKKSKLLTGGTVDRTEAMAVFSELKRRERWALDRMPNRLDLVARFDDLDTKTLVHRHKQGHISTLFPSSERMSELSSDELVSILNDDVKGVYGDDDRRDLRDWIAKREQRRAFGESTPFHDSVLQNSQAVCCIVNKSRVRKVSNEDAYQIDVSRYDVCREEAFSGQPVMSFCSGFLVTNDIVVTAGHCVDSAEDARDLAFVFGFQVPVGSDLLDDTRFVVKSDSVYFGRDLLGRRLDDEEFAPGKSDWAVVKLDRPTSGRTPVKLSTRDVKSGDLVYTIGHPCGLPMKIANNAEVRDASSAVYFRTNLDTYGGNSGSGVWLEDSHELVGILVRGGEDFRYVSVGGSSLLSCRRTVYCGSSEGRGEDVTRVSEWLPVVAPHLAH